MTGPACPHGDRFCPCNDGLPCNYETIPGSPRDRCPRTGTLYCSCDETPGAPPAPRVRKKRERFDPLPHGQAPCPRCDGDDACGFCDGSGIVGDASCWVNPHPEHETAAR